MPNTERMTLRRTNWPDVDDVAALHAARKVPGEASHGPESTGARVLSQEMPRLMAHNGREDQLGSWVARDRSTGGFLGWFTVSPIESSVPTVELSYRLMDRTRGKGYDVEGALRMIAMARDARVAMVIATAMADDVEFRRVIQQAGLRRIPTRSDDATEPAPGTEAGQVDYALDLRG